MPAMMWFKEGPSNRIKHIAAAVVICTFLSIALAWSGFFRTTLRSLPLQGSGLATPYAWAGWHRTERLFVFGDSWSSTGFDYKGHQPDRQNPFGNEPLPPRKDGPNWIHFLTETYNETFVKTYNFAKGGAVVDDKIVKPMFEGHGFTFGEQVHDIFRPEYAARDMPRDRYWDPATTVFALCFGINELSIAFQTHQNLLIPEVVASYFQIVDELYFAGARNFLFLNIPPLDRAYPPQKDTTTMAIQIEDYNKELNAMRQKLIEKTPDANALLFDTHAFYEHILNDPQSLPQTAGITRLQELCSLYYFGVPLTKSGSVELDHYSPQCGAPISEYFWMNQLNPTFPVHNGTAATIVRDCLDGQPKRFCS
ncbi:MAG: hypothetical protein M1828_004886 [Chrysothrix sp. TS-e1954]|nr:MAG: hypothetical protein M1828_004886 [Chrysothrix sp. TS-e1954]